MKAAREKKFLTCKKRQSRFTADLSTERSGRIYCAELEKYAAKNSLSSKAITQNRRREGRLGGSVG